MELVTLDSWDRSFFTLFCSFKNQIHGNIPTSFPVTAQDLETYFGPASPFALDWSWKAFMVKKEGRVLGQAILSHRKGASEGNLGFIDLVNDVEVAKLLIASVENYAKESGLKKMRTPVDLNFFLKYRIRLPGAKGYLYGEPVYPDYYHELFQATNFQVIGQWDTYQIKRWAGIMDFFKKRGQLKQSHGGKPAKTTIRCIRMSKWEEELRIIHQLFSRAYSKMPEYEPINFEQFKAIYDDFRYVVNPLYSYIVELDGRPVGFSINYVDPLPVLAPYKHRKLASWQKALVFLKLRANIGTYMISHIGKVPGPGGEEIKGIQIQVSKRITFTSWFMRRLVVTFQNVHSPSRRSWNPSVWVHHASYVLYGKDLE